MKVKELLALLKSKNINTWFDLGIFIDSFRENRAVPSPEFLGFFEDFKDSIRGGGIAFITFYYGVDGVSIEIEKYAKCFHNILADVPVHYIAGEFYPEGDRFIDNRILKYQIDEIKSFDKWPLYRDFFLTKLERGSSEYNSLIVRFLEEVLVLVEKIGTYIEANNINLLYLINVCSNPGNISLALAVALLSESLGIPVINNNHDFYWEGGARREDLEAGRSKPGPRDVFFRNADLGEVFSIIEMLYPWESRSWISVNINEGQSRHLIEINGHNPANVCEIGTAVDIELFKTATKRNKIKSFIQIKTMLARYKKKLRVYTPQEVIDKKIVRRENLEPLIIGASNTCELDFVNNNILFLQPTRIMARKKIAVGFKLVEKLFNFKGFVSKFASNSQLTLTILATGPIPTGQFQYFLKLLLAFNDLLEKLPEEFRQRLFMGFLFSEFDKETAIKTFSKPVSIPEIYNLASLILLPSETEGRGLPIIEATACGVPIFCRRYSPVAVYDAVIGKHLQEKDRLRVLEFERNVITDKMIKKITEWVFFPHNFRDDIKHNNRAVIKRYSLAALEQNLKEIFLRLYRQLKPNDFSMKRIKMSLNEYHTLVFSEKKVLAEVLDTGKRHYLPGFGRMAFMLFLKSLIDPSYFRVEEQYVRGQVMKFARELVVANQDEEDSNNEKVIRFYNTIDNIFRYRDGEIPIRHDHSMSYRHRNKNYYPYQDFTFQELTGLINIFYNKIVTSHVELEFDQNPHFFTNWELILFQLTNSSTMAIDDRRQLISCLHSNRPFCLFPGEHIIYELELFVLQTVRARLGLQIEEELTEQHLKKNRRLKTFIYIFCPQYPLGKQHTAEALMNFITHKADDELKLVFQYNLCQIVATEQWCVGIHLYQLGDRATELICSIKKENGFLITNNPHAPVMTDIINMDRFHIGKVNSVLTARIMGIPVNSGYIQFVPAGMRTTLAFPTPVQTARSFSRILAGEQYRKICGQMGEEKLLEILKKDAAEHGTPLKILLSKLEQHPGQKQDTLTYEYINGLYADGHPWNGVQVNVNIHQTGTKWGFAVLDQKPSKVTDYCRKYYEDTGKKIRVAWNGGYMLNPELVGKLGLPESYIGSPLGLIISDHEITCPPLFNKPAFLINNAGELEIRQVNLGGGLRISADDISLELKPENYNPAEPGNKPAYYDLLYMGEYIKGDGRVIVQLAGNRIMEVHFTEWNENVRVIPVGISLSFPPDQFPASWNKIGKKLKFEIPGLDDYQYGIEAGPMLVDDGRVCIDMEKGGWKTLNSIRTQAARLDYTDMRGPKIAIGTDKKGDLMVVAVNGRIRESVGATHHDMAEILIRQGAVRGMGFDPGGSSTVVVDGKVLNISPYNSDYEREVVALPPEPRPVGNAVVGWLE